MKKSKSKATASLIASGLIPRGLTTSQAAAYCGLSFPAFAEAVSAGYFPPPLPLSVTNSIWDKYALDNAMDRASRPEHWERPAP